MSMITRKDITEIAIEEAYESITHVELELSDNEVMSPLHRLSNVAPLKTDSHSDAV